MAVRVKCSRSSEAAHGIADLAVDAGLYLARNYRAGTMIYVRALIQHKHSGLRAFFRHLIGRKDTGFTGAEYYKVVSFIHGALFTFPL